MRRETFFKVISAFQTYAKRVPGVKVQQLSLTARQVADWGDLARNTASAALKEMPGMEQGLGGWHITKNFNRKELIKHYQEKTDITAVLAWWEGQPDWDGQKTEAENSPNAALSEDEESLLENYRASTTAAKKRLVEITDLAAKASKKWQGANKEGRETIYNVMLPEALDNRDVNNLMKVGFMQAVYTDELNQA